VTTPLLEDLKSAGTAPAPKDFRPGITYSGRDALGATINTDAIPAVTTEDEWEEAVRAMGIFLPEGYGLQLVTAELAGSENPAAWKRDPDNRGQKDTAYTAPNTITRWRYRFKVVLKFPRADQDIATLMREAKRAGRGRPLTTRTGGSMVISLADFQVGKVDRLGGTPELLLRSEVALAAKIAEAKRLRPAQIILVDAGDSTEGFESSPNADRTNDLQQTEQIRVWRRIAWRWIEAMAKLTEDLVWISVPSNHCGVRKGKNYLGTTLDDWGIEVTTQLADIAVANPAAFGHVRFLVPDEHEEHVLFQTVDGLWLGVIHGHQVGQPNQLGEFFKKNSRRGIGQADIIICGHFHHLRFIAFGDGQFFIVSPTMDGGSTWYQYSGEVSNPAVLSVLIDAEGWRDLHLAWAA
jgi:hypothetical protein